MFTWSLFQREHYQKGGCIDDGVHFMSVLSEDKVKEGGDDSEPDRLDQTWLAGVEVKTSSRPEMLKSALRQRMREKGKKYTRTALVICDIWISIMTKMTMFWSR